MSVQKVRSFTNRERVNDPQPPSWEEIASEADQALKALGCGPLRGSLDKRVYDALLTHYEAQRGRETAEPLPLVALQKSLACKRTTLQMAIERMLASGSLRKADRGVYVPVLGARPD